MAASRLNIAVDRIYDSDRKATTELQIANKMDSFADGCRKDAFPQHHSDLW